MVRLYTSLVTITLATGWVLAFSNEYERRSGLEQEEELVVRQPFVRHLRLGLALAPGRQNSFQSREFEDYDDLFGRDTMDDLETREPLSFGSAEKFAELVHSHKKTLNRIGKFAHGFNEGQQIAGSIQNRGLEDDEGLFSRDLDAFEDLEVREPRVPLRTIEKVAELGRKHGKTFKRLGRVANGINQGQQFINSFQNRGLEDVDELAIRGLDVEEFFEREYDPLEERDAFDDLD